MGIYSLETITVVCIKTNRLPKNQNHTEIPIKNGIKYYRFIECLSSSRDRKLTFSWTNACHEVGIEMNIMLKEMGADSLLEAFLFFALKVDTTCVKILLGKR